MGELEGRLSANANKNESIPSALLHSRSADTRQNDTRRKHKQKQSTERDERVQSPMRSNSSKSSSSTKSTIHESEVIKELIRLIPRYNRHSGIQKLMEYIDSFEAYAASTELSHQAELTLVTANSPEMQRCGGATITNLC